MNSFSRRARQIVTYPVENRNTYLVLEKRDWKISFHFLANVKFICGTSLYDGFLLNLFPTPDRRHRSHDTSL